MLVGYARVSTVDQDLSRLSPTRFEHVNRYGRYRFDM
jgi:rRNA maturation protein Nop10